MLEIEMVSARKSWDESARRGDIGWTARSSSTAYARGGREQGVHLLETCSLYPLLIERSGPGLHWSGLDTPATPNRRTISQTLTSHPTPPYIRKNICMCCACMCTRVKLWARMRERESSAAKRRPKTLCPEEDGHPGGGSYDSDVYFEKIFPSVWVSYVSVCVPAHTTPYWILDIERRWSSVRWTAVVATNMKFSYIISIVKRIELRIRSYILDTWTIIKDCVTQNIKI